MAARLVADVVDERRDLLRVEEAHLLVALLGRKLDADARRAHDEPVDFGRPHDLREGQVGGLDRGRSESACAEASDPSPNVGRLDGADEDVAEGR
jgi:hypothetical protein